MATWSFHCIDNGGKRQCFTVKAKDKQEAIEKAFKRAEKHVRGEIGFSWDCRLIIP